jgi:hypothetical protein
LASDVPTRLQSPEAKIGSPRNRSLRKKKEFGTYELSADQRKVTPEPEMAYQHDSRQHATYAMS